MKYILLISLFAFCGCSRNEWEFQKKVPLTTSVSDLLQMETELRAKGLYVAREELKKLKDKEEK